jgi:hypothetical protein
MGGLGGVGINLGRFRMGELGGVEARCRMEDLVGLGEALEVWMGTMEDSRGEDMEVLGEAEEVWKEAMEVLM